jgi:shikimate dehydrogenase
MRPGRLVLVGHPVSHSLSPRFQNAALRAAGIPLEYEAIDVAPDGLQERMRALLAADAAGNVTIPHKEAVFALCAARSPTAERVGAVNTFWVERGGLVGDNTDVGGFDAAVRSAFGPPLPNVRVAILGAGGAAAAVIAAVEQWPGAHAVVTSRSRARAEVLAHRFAPSASVAESAARAVEGAGLVVNATPVGLHGDALPIVPRLLAPNTRVFDLAYRPGLTPWVVEARARGLSAVDGLGMLIEQGALSFTRWFGIEPDRAAMWAAVPDPAR